MKPLMGMRLAQTKLQTMHGLERVGFVIHQDEQQLVFDSRQPRFLAAAGLSLAQCSFSRMSAGQGGFIVFSKNRNQAVKLSYRQTRHAQKTAGIVFQLGIS